VEEDFGWGIAGNKDVHCGNNFKVGYELGVDISIFI
jgi:hypothetical protein